MSSSSSSLHRLTLVAGYTTHGKDTFAKDLMAATSSSSFASKWILLSRPDQKWLPEQALGFGYPRKHVAFAAALKGETLKWLGMPVDWRELESLKDTLHVMPPTWEDPLDHSWQTRSDCLLRSHYIAYGAEKRRENVDYWCAKAGEAFQNCSAIVTDLRFPNEHAWVLHNCGTQATNPSHTIKTVRVFRSAAPIPNEHIQTEHAMDEFVTDYLALATLRDLGDAIKQFPQYADFVVCGPV